MMMDFKDNHILFFKTFIK